MKKILLLSTGGTIASVKSNHGLVPKLSAKTILEFIPQLSQLCEIEYEEILNLDSSNIQPEHWNLLAEKIYTSVFNYDGFVITHGTDTMAYTASMLSFMLLGISKPVILTGSQLPIVFPNTDAKDNLYHAFLTAISELKGIYVVFNQKIIQGVRAKKLHTEHKNAFESVNAPLAGYIENNKVILSYTSKQIPDSFSLYHNIDNSVFLLKLIPGINSEIIPQLVKMGYKAIILESFGAGGIPHHTKDFLYEIEKAINLGIIIICATQCIFGSVSIHRYEVGVKAAEIGVFSAKDMTIEALYTKLMWVLGQTNQKQIIKEMMEHDYCGEITTS